MESMTHEGEENSSFQLKPQYDRWKLISEQPMTECVLTLAYICMKYGWITQIKVWANSGRTRVPSK